MKFKMKRWVSLFLMLTMVFTAISVPIAANAETTLSAADTVDPDLFVEEDFDYENGALSGKDGGLGWGSNKWWVRNDHTEGYLVANTAPISYSGLKSSKPYGTGGWAYCETGRVFDTSAQALAPYVSDGNVSKVGSTIWASGLYAVKRRGSSYFSLSHNQHGMNDTGSLQIGATDSSWIGMEKC